MIPRAAVQAIVESAVPADMPVFGSNAADAVDVKGLERFVVLHWGETTQAIGWHGPSSLTVWAHSRDRDYGPLDVTLLAIGSALLSSQHVPGDDGVTLTQVDWQGLSDDLLDDGYGTATKNAGFAVVGRKP
jgi:hypothetical protein